jgi:hypothetical protein
MYIHRQFGWFTVFALTAMAVWFAFVAALSPGDRGEFQSIFLMIAALQLAFYQLTTVVTESTLTVRYGIGLVAFRFPISEIKQVSERTVPWYAGYGIRWVGDAWLFNVSGRDAIEVTFDSGRKVWVGTDDPDGLAAILRQRMEELRLSAVDTDTDAASPSDDVEEPVETVDATATDCEENTDTVADVSIELDAPQADTITNSDSE